MEGWRSLWYSPNNKKVGGHCPTKILQSFFLATFSAADARMEATAPQYQACSGILSVMRKYDCCELDFILLCSLRCYRGDIE